MPRPVIDLTGKTFGAWKVLEFAYRKVVGSGIQVFWKCQCKCGRIRYRYGSTLKAGHTKSCGKCNYFRKTRPYETIYHVLVGAAKSRKLECTLTYEDFLKFTRFTKCHYCKRLLHWPMYKEKGKPFGHNLDRKDNDTGYVNGNCVVCCPTCNRAKMNHFTYNQWRVLAKGIQEHPELFKEKHAD